MPLPLVHDGAAMTNLARAHVSRMARPAHHQIEFASNSNAGTTVFPQLKTESKKSQWSSVWIMLEIEPRLSLRPSWVVGNKSPIKWAATDRDFVYQVLKP
jgi:hypothetical protein